MWRADCKLGCQCPFDHLQFHRFLHQALNPAPILANFCACSKGQHGYVPYNPCRHLESPCLLFAGYCIFLGLCSPRRKIWQPWLPNGHCFSSDIWNMASGMFNAISDIIILILPMPCLWRLQMPLKKKLITMGIFATGAL